MMERVLFRVTGRVQGVFFARPRVTKLSRTGLPAGCATRRTAASKGKRSARPTFSSGSSPGSTRDLPPAAWIAWRSQAARKPPPHPKVSKSDIKKYCSHERFAPGIINGGIIPGAKRKPARFCAGFHIPCPNSLRYPLFFSEFPPLPEPSLAAFLRSYYLPPSL